LVIKEVVMGSLLQYNKKMRQNEMRKLCCACQTGTFAPAIQKKVIVSSFFYFDIK
jgi:hypothetical protein